MRDRLTVFTVASCIKVLYHIIFTSHKQRSVERTVLVSLTASFSFLSKTSYGFNLAKVYCCNRMWVTGCWWGGVCPALMLLNTRTIREKMSLRVLLIKDYNGTLEKLMMCTDNLLYSKHCNIQLKMISKELFHGDFNIYFTDLSLKFTGIRRKSYWMGIMSTL